MPSNLPLRGTKHKNKRIHSDLFSLPECVPVSTGPWTPPCRWSGPDPAFYQSFDSLDGLVLMEGTEQISLPGISGKVIHTDTFNNMTDSQ